MEMVYGGSISISSYSYCGIIGMVVILWAVWSLLDWLWLKPMKIEKLLRGQGFTGNSYRLLFGDTKEISKMMKEAMSKPINLSDEILPRVAPLVHLTAKKHGGNYFIWYGPIPRLYIKDPQIIKEVLFKHFNYSKIKSNPITNLLAKGIAKCEGQKWVKHKKIINPAFHMEKLKHILPEFHRSCIDMVCKWEDMISSSANGSIEIDIWPEYEALSGDVISRAAFGSNYKEGKRIFQLQKEQSKYVIEALSSFYIPGSRFLPTKRNKKMKEICREVNASMRKIVDRRLTAMKEGKTIQNTDLLGVLLESNLREIEQDGSRKSIGLSIEEVIEECKLFYLAGQETAASTLVWTSVLLAKHQDWQERAREEVFQVFGKNKPDFDGLSQLKTVTMILYEVMRLYPPIVAVNRAPNHEVKLEGGLVLPAGVQLSFMTLLSHRDPQIWGDDANEFKPERFSEGVSKATKNQLAYFPFGWGPKTCIGQNFGMMEVKIAIAMILQRFSFEVSPSYAHAPLALISLQPQYGAHLVLHKF